MVPYQTSVETHTASVSIRDQLTDAMRRQEAKLDLEFASANRIAVVEIAPGLRVPAAIGFRTIVTEQTRAHGRITDHWHVTLAPFDESLLRRLFAERNKPGVVQSPVRPGARLTSAVFDPPISAQLEASYDAVAAMKKAHKAFSDWRPLSLRSSRQRSLSRAI